ncbi:MAG: hypothetical protein ABIK09_16650 [Pseudomonadota bacterium]
MRWMWFSVALVLCSCASAGGRVNQTCRPTGWIDRVEGLWVIIEPDDEDAETLVLPSSCFREPVHGGLRIVDGRIDRVETEALRREMARITARLTKAPDDQD